MKYRALATDYDGTLANLGVVDEPTLRALRNLRESGWRVLLVTGRELTDLFKVFPEPKVFDLIVAENGALMHNPLTGADRILATAPPVEFVDRLRERGVPLFTGRVIVATVEAFLHEVQTAILEMHLELKPILNKGSVMVLPNGVDKGTGLRWAAKELSIPVEQMVTVGDAENDFPFLRESGLSVAVSNALPAVKELADWTTPSNHGAGVTELVERLLSGRFNWDSS
jgi:hydroxymethylpyrimidine pyrophosphatase-like HAD family hydrolase